MGSSREAAIGKQKRPAKLSSRRPDPLANWAFLDIRIRKTEVLCQHGLQLVRSTLTEGNRRKVVQLARVIHSQSNPKNILRN